VSPGSASINFDLQFEVRLGEFQRRIYEARNHNKAICIKHRVDITGLFEMTPQEQLFAKFFSAEAVLVSTMDNLTLEAHRELLVEIITEARAKLTAVDRERDNRRSNGRKISVFESSINTDEKTSEAINAINQRAVRLSKAEKVLAGLIKMGIPEAEAQQMMSARNIKDHVNASTEGRSRTKEPFSEPARFTNPFRTKESFKTSENVEIKDEKPFVNPFKKQE